MIGRLFTLIGLWSLSMSLWGIPNHELLTNLRSRLHTLPHSEGKLIKSFADHSQSYIYDQALAVIAFTHAGDQTSARSLLTGLQKLQLQDGSLYFSYYLDGKSPYPTEGDKRYAGAIAWVALAATHYQLAFKSQEFKRFNAQVLTYLASEIRQVHDKDSLRALRFSPSDITSTAWDEKQTAALEHNLDAYAAFRNFEMLNPQDKWKTETQDLKKFILSMWDKSRSHFWSGINIKSGVINTQELYLDNQTWTLLALEHEALKELDMKSALTLNCEEFFTNHKGVIGFYDSRPTRTHARVNFVWSEGSLGQVLAMQRFNQIHHKDFACQEMNETALLDSIKKMKSKDGGIAYATSGENPDFTTSSSVAGTTWMYFAANGMNPFSLAN